MKSEVRGQQSEVIELVITPEDLAKAQQEHIPASGNIICSCLVYQAARRAGLNPINCRYHHVHTKASSYALDLQGRVITHARHEDWPDFIGRKFTLTEVPAGGGE